MQILLIVCAIIAAFVGLVSPEVIEHFIGSNFPDIQGARGILLIFALIGIFSLIGDLLARLEEFKTYFAALSLKVELRSFLVLSSLVGGFAAVVGSSSYIFFETPASLVGTSSFPELVVSAWEVKLVRVLAFGMSIGFCLSLILTHFLLYCIFRKYIEKRPRKYLIELIRASLSIVFVAAVYAYLGGHMSEVGNAMAGLAALVGSDPAKADEYVSFGSGMCRNIAEYNSLPKSGASNNNICDVGPIGGLSIILSVVLFNLYWLIFVRIAGGPRAPGVGPLRDFARVLLENLTLSLAVIVSFAAFIYFVTNVDDPNVRQVIVDSQLAIVGLSTVLAILSVNCMRSTCKFFRTGDPNN